MSKYDRMDVFAGDPEPDCFGEVRGCLVPHCYWAKYCYDRALKNENKNLNGIKSALRFFIEREKEQELQDLTSHSHHGIWRDYNAKQEYIDRERRKINKKYAKILDDLKTK